MMFFLFLGSCTSDYIEDISDKKNELSPQDIVFRVDVPNVDDVSLRLDEATVKKREKEFEESIKNMGAVPKSV